MAEVAYPYKGLTDMELELEDRAREKAGAGRGGQGGPTAKELANYERKMNKKIYTESMGKPPQDIDGRSAMPKKIVKKAGGGLASKRADGIAKRGKTRGKMC